MDPNAHAPVRAAPALDDGHDTLWSIHTNVSVVPNSNRTLLRLPLGTRLAPGR